MAKEAKDTSKGTITFYVGPELKKKLYDLVEVMDTNVSRLVRNLIKKELASKKIKKVGDLYND